MADVYMLRNLKEILKKVAEDEKCVEITGYDGRTILYFSEVLDKVIKRYVHESDRVKRFRKKLKC